MAQDGDDQKETQHECVYVGSHSVEVPLDSLDQTPAPPSDELARSVSLSVLCGNRGSLKSMPHCNRRMKERNFDIFDIEYAIRNGRCVKVEYCAEYQDHKFTFRCLIDGVEFDAVFALSARHDLIKAPLMVLITGCWKTSNGDRCFRY